MWALIQKSTSDPLQGSNSALQALGSSAVPMEPLCCPYLVYICVYASQLNLSHHSKSSFFKQVPLMPGGWPKWASIRDSLYNLRLPVLVQAQATTHLDFKHIPGTGQVFLLQRHFY